MTRYAKLPVWSDEWMFGVTRARIINSLRLENGRTIVKVKIPGLKKPSSFYVDDVEIET